LVPTADTGALMTLQFVETRSELSSRTHGAALLGHSSAQEFAGNSIIRISGAATKFATRERFNVTGN
jgi:hypothetical protein